MLVLGIESSCDETGAAVVRADGEVLSDVVQSQVKLHAPYGGVVPELASRDHLKNVRPVVLEAVSRAAFLSRTWPASPSLVARASRVRCSSACRRRAAFRGRSASRSSGSI